MLDKALNVIVETVPHARLLCASNRQKSIFRCMHLIPMFPHISPSTIYRTLVFRTEYMFLSCFIGPIPAIAGCGHL